MVALFAITTLTINPATQQISAQQKNNQRSANFALIP
jgi:hypothetical protein